MSGTRVTTVDYHTGGEPFRIVTSQVSTPGETVADRRRRALDSAETQHLRRVLCWEPRGHADMYGCFVTPPDDDGADLGVLFWHKDGFSTACGHGTIALATWAVESGRVAAAPDGDTDVIIDVPSGRVRARVTCIAGCVTHVAFINVSSWMAASNVPIRAGGRRVAVDIAYGGAFYAMLPAAELGLRVVPTDYAALVDAGRAIKHAADRAHVAVHPADDRLSGVYGTILYEPEHSDDGDVHQRNLTVFADGEADRSPCGSGTCARIAALAQSGDLTYTNRLVHTSIVGSTFTGRIVRFTGDGAVVPEIVGRAYRTGASTFEVDDRDELAEGFVLR